YTLTRLPDQPGFSRNPSELGCEIHRVLKIARFVDELALLCISSCKYTPVSNGADFLQVQFATRGYRLNELYVHVVNQALKILTFILSDRPRRRSSILELAGFENDIFQLRPLQQIRIVHPLCNHSDATHNSSRIRDNFVGCAGDIKSTRGAGG